MTATKSSLRLVCFSHDIDHLLSGNCRSFTKFGSAALHYLSSFSSAVYTFMCLHRKCLFSLSALITEQKGYVFLAKTLAKTLAKNLAQWWIAHFLTFCFLLAWTIHESGSPPPPNPFTKPFFHNGFRAGRTGKEPVRPSGIQTVFLTGAPSRGRPV